MIFLCIGNFHSVFLGGNEGLGKVKRLAKGEFWGKIDLLLLRFAFGFVIIFCLVFFFR